MRVTCPHCRGEGGSTSYGEREWSDCSTCDGLGSITPCRAAAYEQELADLDDWVSEEVTRMEAAELNRARDDITAIPVRPVGGG